jgi:hypothetical protein
LKLAALFGDVVAPIPDDTPRPKCAFRDVVAESLTFEETDLRREAYRDVDPLAPIPADAVRTQAVWPFDDDVVLTATMNALP